MPRPVDATIRKTPLRAGEELRVDLSAFRGQQYLHCRRWYRDGKVWKPGKGLGIRIDMLPWLLRALRDTEGTALNSGHLEIEDYERAGQDPPAALSEGAPRSHPL